MKRITFTSLIVAGLLAAAPAAAELPAEVAGLWNDPSFQKAFVGSYGINSEVEPRVLPEELKFLEKLRPQIEKDLAKAEEMLKKQIESGSKKKDADYSPLFDFTLASVQYQMQKLDDAEANYETAVSRFPAFRRAWRNLGLIRVQQGDHDGGIEAFTSMIKLGGGDEYSYGLLGYAYAEKQDFQPAEAAFRNALLLKPDSFEWRLGLTRCVFKQEKYEDSVTLLNELIERFPNKADFWILQAHSFLGLKQPLKAAQNFEALDLIGGSTVDTLFTLGDIYLSESLPDLALSAYRRGVDLKPDQPATRSIRAAEVLSSRGAPMQARELALHVQSSLGPSLSDDERAKLLKLQARLAMAAGEATAETVAVLEEILKLNPLDGEALLLLGQHYAKDDPQQAIFYYQRAAGIDGVERQASLRHAQVLIAQEKYAEALPLLQRAQEISPRAEVEKYIEQIQGLMRRRAR